MPLIPTFIRLVLATLVLAFAAPSIAEEATAPEAEWQAVITHQIQAFRDKDAPAAFSDAAAPFQANFPSANAFFAAIIGSGYSPIMESKSHTFGAFELDPTSTNVIQVVKFVGASQELYEAIYNLTHEEGGWRVQGVILGHPSGVGI